MCKPAGPAKGKTWSSAISAFSITGDMNAPLSDADTIVSVDGRIAAVGKAKDIDTANATTVIDAKGTAVCPGLIDSHVHPVFGDWTPRQNQIGWIDSFLNGGVTTMVSAGEVHLPGRPKDIVGLKALAITAQRSSRHFRPGGVKLHAGAPVLEKGMVEEDFAELARAGVTLLGEVGLGSVKAGYEAKEMVAWARKHGHPIHHPYRRPVDPGFGPDRQGHGARGGCRCDRPYQWRAHVAAGSACVRIVRSLEARHRACAQRQRAGRHRRAQDGAGDEEPAPRHSRHRFSPAGSGVQPLGILRMVALLSGLGGFRAELRHRLRHGQHGAAAQARLRLDRSRAAPADLVFIDRAQHTAGTTVLKSIELGDLPGIGMVMIDGIVRCGRSRNTPPADGCRK